MARSPLGIIAIALVSPIVEELVFREAIIRTMLNQGCGIWKAILFSALSFGIIHFNPAQIPFAFVMGIILGIIYVRTRSVLLTVLIHIVNNGLAVIEINVLGERINELSYSEVMGGNALAWTCIIVSATLCIAFLLQFWKIDDCKLK